MCDLTEVQYLPGEIVWVKLGNCWWPGEVKDTDSLPEDMVRDFKKKPMAIVKFFGEDSYEYVKNLDNIYHYNNRRKMEFIKKGMDLYRSKSKQGLTLMDKFPTDVVTAESLSGGNVNILKSPAFMPEEKVDYRELFESPKKKAKKNADKPGVSSLRSTEKASSSSRTSSGMAKANNIIQIKQRITHPRFVKESDHEIRIRQQPVPSSDAPEFQHAYQCQECKFGTNRQNLFILHCKSHRDQEKSGGKPSTSSGSSTKVSTKASTKTTTPRVRKSATPKPAAASTTKSTPAAPKAASVPKPAAKKAEKSSPSKDSAVMVRKIFQTPKKGKRGAPKKFPPKTDEEIAKEREKRNKILADWDEDEQEEEMEIKKLKLDTSATESTADETTEMEQDDEEEEKETAPEAEEAEKLEPEPKEPEKKEEAPKDAGSVYDIIEEPEAIAPPPARESKEETAKEKEKLSKDVEDLLMETAMPSLPELPTLPNIPIKKSEKEPIKDQKEEQSAASIPLPAQSAPVEAKSAEPAKTNGEVTGATEEAVTVTPSEETVDSNTETATYVLVTVDEGGFHQLSGLGEMGTTLYIDPSQLSGSGTSLDNLYLAIDEGSIAQLDHQQVSLQVAPDMAKTTQQDILAAALANTQVLQTTALEPVTQEAVVKVTNTTQAPVMTPRVTESSASSVTQSNGAAGNATS